MLYYEAEEDDDDNDEEDNKEDDDDDKEEEENEEDKEEEENEEDKEEEDEDKEEDAEEEELTMSLCPWSPVPRPLHRTVTQVNQSINHPSVNQPVLGSSDSLSTHLPTNHYQSTNQSTSVG